MFSGPGIPSPRSLVVGLLRKKLKKLETEQLERCLK